MKKTYALILVVVAFMASALLAGCSIDATTNPITCIGGAVEGDPIFKAVIADSDNNNRLVAAGILGLGLENDWSNKDSKDGAFGWWQLQNPGVSGGPNPNVSVDQAHDPAYSTNYMMPQYKQSLAVVSSSLWISNPELAAEKTVMGAERPATDYYQTRPVHARWLRTIQYMNALGVPTDFSGTVRVAVATIPSSTTTVGDSCGGGYTDGKTAQQLAKEILANKNINLSVFPDVRQDVEDAAGNKPGTAGAMTSAAILRLIAVVGKSHTVTVNAIQSSGTSHCWKNGVPHGPGSPYGPCSFVDQHYIGNAVDFGMIDGTLITGRDSGALKIISIAEQVLSGGEFGQSQCGSHVTLVPHFSQFKDDCSHLHVDTKIVGGD